MAKARDISKGDWITIGGKPVKVTHSELDLDGRWSISWARGSSSGMRRCPPKTEIKRPGKKS